MTIGAVLLLGVGRAFAIENVKPVTGSIIGPEQEGSLTPLRFSKRRLNTGKTTALGGPSAKLSRGFIASGTKCQHSSLLRKELLSFLRIKY